jgi:hypothetical protein
MSKLASNALPLDEGNEDPKSKGEQEMTGGDREIKWKTVTKTAGLMPAEIIGGRLQAEGIPVRVWQEGAGQAFGLTVGLLGTGYVQVPEDYLEQAEEILASEPDLDASEDEEQT